MLEQSTWTAGVQPASLLRMDSLGLPLEESCQHAIIKVIGLNYQDLLYARSCFLTVHIVSQCLSPNITNIHTCTNKRGGNKEYKKSCERVIK